MALRKGIALVLGTLSDDRLRQLEIEVQDEWERRWGFSSSAVALGLERSEESA